MRSDRLSPGTEAGSSASLRRLTWILALVWTATIVASLAWNVRQENEGALKMARTQARTAHQKDVVYRRWSALHGGAYVPRTERTPSNEYLMVPERDIVTPSGRELTLINPAYMTRQVHELEAELFGVRGHITSLDPLRPGNEPDSWEAVALEAFEMGAKEYSSVEPIKGEPFMRLMRPLVTEKGCLKCHEDQGYAIGDIRGGISVAVPMAPIHALAARKLQALMLGHGVLWVLGLAGLLGGSRRLQQRARERDRAEAALARRNEFLNTILESLTHPFVVIDAEDRSVVMANSEARRNAEDGARKCHEMLFQRSRPCDEHELECPLAAVKAGAGAQTLEHASAGEDGGTRTLEIQTYPILGEDGRVVQMIEYTRDVTERKRMESELQLNHKLKSLGQLADSLAHEINTPIQYIQDNLSFFSESVDTLLDIFDKYKDIEDSADKETVEGIREKWRLMEEEEELDFLRGEVPKAVRQSVEGVERISTIVNAMMDVSPTGGTQNPLSDVNRLVSSALVVSRNQWSGIADVETDFDPDLPAVRCVPSELSQAILSLVFNAAEAVRAAGDSISGHEGRIRVSTHRRAGWGEIQIRDNGPGIPAEIRDRIFDPFFTTKDVGEGTGQGLTTAQAIVTQSAGGTLSFETEEGEGTTFIIRLPIAEDTSAEV